LFSAFFPARLPVKLRDFESAVNNFEKALERAKLVHNNEAQQAIISVSICQPLGWGGVEWVARLSAPLAFPQLLIAHPSQDTGRQGAGFDLCHC
jgi:hypothetical protein